MPHFILLVAVVCVDTPFFLRVVDLLVPSKNSRSARGVASARAAARAGWRPRPCRVRPRWPRAGPAACGRARRIRRSPGNNSGAVISAKARSSKSESCKSPASISLRITGAGNAVIHPSPAGRTSSRMRAIGEQHRVADEHDARRGEGLAQLPQLSAEGAGIGGVTFGEPGQRALRALEIDRGAWSGDPECGPAPSRPPARARGRRGGPGASRGPACGHIPARRLGGGGAGSAGSGRGRRERGGRRRP